MARPRKSGPRTKSGRLSRSYRGAARDAGTPELQAKRLAVVNGSGDPALSASALRILFAHGHVDRDQLAAGERYASAHAIVFPQVGYVASLLGEHTGGRQRSVEMIAAVKDRLDGMDARLTPEQRQRVAAVAVFNHLPDWFLATTGSWRAMPEDRRDRDALISGLEALR